MRKARSGCLKKQLPRIALLFLVFIFPLFFLFTETVEAGNCFSLCAANQEQLESYDFTVANCESVCENAIQQCAFGADSVTIYSFYTIPCSEVMDYVGGGSGSGSSANGVSGAVQCDLAKLDPPVTEKSFFLPDCVYFEGESLDLQKKCGCRNVNVLVDFLVLYANGFFMLVGGGALLFFVYGGFVILTAAGGERVKKGKDIIVAAVIGLIIIFTAQVGLKFILNALLKPAPTEKPASAPATLEGLNIKVKE